ncbi:MAG: methyltransferase domain-containing protein [Gammaproteobacteria bacterium]|nr:methyltransferase domain-containing protein [Gammaproteobacteria bacterium]
MDIKAQEKWNRIYADSEVAAYSVTKILEEYAYLLPKKGVALDLACGLGSDAVFLAEKGLTVKAWDISDQIVTKINTFAQKQKLAITAEARDVVTSPPAANSFEVITVAHYLDRNIVPALIASLKPGGLIFYQTFLKEVTPDYSGPSNPDFRLGKNELLQLFAELDIVFYQEDALIGDLQQGLRNEAMLIARKAG